MDAPVSPATQQQATQAGIPKRPPTMAAARKWLVIVLLGAGTGLVGVGQLVLTSSEQTLAPGLRLLAAGVVAFGAALWLSFPPDAAGVRRVLSTVGAIVRQQPVRVLLVLLSLVITWVLTSGLRASGGVGSWSLAPLWAAAWGSFLLACMPWRLRGDGPREWLHTYWIEVAIAAGITLAGAALRGIALGSIPSIVDGDEGKLALLGLAALHGEINNPFANNFGNGTIYLYLLGQGMNLLGDNPAGLRLATTVAGTLTIPVTYLLARRVGGPRAAVIGASLLAVSHIHIHFSRVAMTGTSMDALFAVTVVYLLDRGLQRRSAATLALCGLLMSFHFYIYMGANLMVIVVAAALAIRFLVHREEIVANARGLVALGGALFITAAPLVAWILSHPDIFMDRISGRGIVQNGWLAAEAERRQLSEWRIVLGQVGKALLALNYYPSKWFYDSPLPMMNYFSAVPFVLGLVYLVIRPLRDRLLMLLLVWIGLALLLGNAFLVEPEGSQYRFLIVVPALAIVASLGLLKVWDMAIQVGAPVPVIAGGCALWLAAAAYTNVNYYFREFAPSCAYIGAEGRLADFVGRYVGQQPRLARAYLFGEPRVRYGTHQSVDFLRRGRSIANAREVPATQEQAAPGGVPLVLLFVPERRAEYEEAVERFPGGRTVELRDCGALVLRAYHVPTGSSTPPSGTGQHAAPVVPRRSTVRQQPQPTQAPAGGATKDALVDTGPPPRSAVDGRGVHNVPAGRQLRLGGPDGQLYDVLPGGKIMPAREIKRWPAPAPPR